MSISENPERPILDVEEIVSVDTDSLAQDNETISQQCSEMAMRMSLLGKLIIPPAHP